VIKINRRWLHRFVSIKELFKKEEDEIGDYETVDFTDDISQK